MLCQVLRLRWKTAARTSSHVATCNHMQPLAATCPAATCSHLQPLLQPLAATCSFLQPLAATCSHWQVAASGCFFENQIAHLLRPQWTIALKCSLNILHHITSVIFYWTLHPCLQKQGPFGCEEGCRITSLAFAPRMRCFKKRAFYSLPGEKRQELIRALQVCRTAPLLMPWEGLTKHTNTTTRLLKNITWPGRQGSTLLGSVDWLLQMPGRKLSKEITYLIIFAVVRLCIFSFVKVFEGA